MKKKNSVRLLVSRLLIFIVLALNLQCALSFIFNPLPYIAPYELSGEGGRAAIIGTGILFVMWQVPYVFALAHPRRNSRSLLEAVLMQVIGVVGESLLLTTIPAANESLRSSIVRFIKFDAGGVVLLVGALLLALLDRNKYVGEKHAN